MRTSLAIIFFPFLLSFKTFALDSSVKPDFDFNFLNSTFKVTSTAECNDERFYNSEIRIHYHAGKNEMEIYANENLIQSIKFLNKGKSEFSNCWSNGTKGFYLNEFFANKIIYNKTVYATGSLCSEGRRVRLEEQVFSFTLEGLSIKSKFIDDKNDFSSETTCLMHSQH